MNPEDIHNLDESITTLSDYYSSMCWSIYSKSIDQSFTEEQKN